LKISIAKYSELYEISKFIKYNWNKNHILATNKIFFSYIYKNNKKLNFVTCRNNTNSLVGILGFIKSSYTDYTSIWTTMWKVKKEIEIMSGLKMLLKLCENKKYIFVMSVGINNKTIDIYQYLKFKTGKLNHHFIPNQNLKKKIISKIPKSLVIKNFAQLSNNFEVKQVTLKEIKKKFIFKKLNNFNPYKDYLYVKRKFFNHPINNYKFYGLVYKNEILCFVILRIQNYKTSNCMRILDFYGKERYLKYITSYLMNSKEFKSSEYLDFYNYGLNEKYLKEAGFLNKKNFKKNLVIPDLFGPFLKKNTDVLFFINKKKINNVRIFRADGDQDTPINKNI
jgi:hypothetical protein